jgi:peptide/nickel transport system substrate-binding protein
LVLALALALVAGACSSGDDETPQATGSTVAAPANLDATLTVGFTEDQYVLSGPETSLGEYPLNANIIETLATMTPDYKVVPALAESWTLVPPSTWRIKIRPGVKFHDGQPLNAMAVKVGLFDRLAAMEGGSSLKATPTSAVVVDDSTVDFTPRVPNLRVPEQMVHPQYAVVAPGSDLGKKPVGTGPFRFVEYVPKERIVVERNPDYWGPKAKLARITFRFYPDASTRRLALESGEIDAAFEVPRDDVAGLKSRGFQILTSGVGSYDALLVNQHGKPGFDILSDVAVRQAVALGIDRATLVSGVLAGLATTDQTIVAPASLAPHTSTITGFAFDQAKARSMLDAAGWAVGGDGVRAKGGRKLRLVLVSGFPAAEILRPIPAFVQSQLKEIGIEVAITERPDSDSYGAVMDAGDGDLFLEQGNQNDANPGFLPTLLFYTGPGAGTPFSYQKLFAPGGRFDQLLAPSLSEPNPENVRRTVADAMHQFIDVDAAAIPLAGIYRIYGARKGIQGLAPHPAFLHVRWDTVSVSA